MLDKFTCTCNILDIYMIFKLELTHCLLIHIKKSVSFLNTFLLKSICTLIKYYQNEKDKIFFKF